MTDFDYISLPGNHANDSAMATTATFMTDLSTGESPAFPPLQIDQNNIIIAPLPELIPLTWTTLPVNIDTDFLRRTMEYAEKHGEAVLLAAKNDPSKEEISQKTDLFHIGVVGKVMKVLELPDGSVTAFVITYDAAEIVSIKRKRPYIRGVIELFHEGNIDVNDAEMNALMVNVFEKFNKIIDTMEQGAAAEIKFALKQMDNPSKLLNFVITTAPITREGKLSLLEIRDIKERIYKLAHILDYAYQVMQLKVDIQERTKEELSQQQREHFLQQQLRSIQDELGNSEDKEMEKFIRKAEQKVWKPEVRKFFENELNKLQRFNTSSPDYSVQYNYLERILSLPWDNICNEQFTLSKVEKILNRDHYGLEKVKERIVEHMAVLKLRGDMKSPIICLYGPPGVGKTSLGKSIAAALGREYARVSFGGLHDESEIRGHRRTYIGAMPGRIIDALSKCKTNNPVFVLDEIDKIGKDFKGDPSTALLEVLDPEQNNKFHDNYLDFDYDLSKVLFIATANELDSISRPLLDRMEVIDISGYITEEKTEIALRHLLPKLLVEHGFGANEIKFDKKAIVYIIERYTRESGVRALEKNIAKILRKIARQKATNPGSYTLFVDKQQVRVWLGPEKVNPDEYESNEFTGVVTGLAWTAVGGEILFIETSLSKGKGELSMTGNLGNVMKESATLARQYLKAHADELGIEPEKFSAMDVHIHVPEGAVPKDGPSAGITIATSLASAFTGRKVARQIAMTGEITLRGKVLPVGGIKEKILAAKRAGITRILLSSKNRSDVEEIPVKYLKGLSFTYVDTVSQVWQEALL